MVRTFVKLSSFLVTGFLVIFTLSSDNLDEKKNISKSFCRYSFEAYLPSALKNSANLMPVMQFYSKF